MSFFLSLDPDRVLEKNLTKYAPLFGFTYENVTSEDAFAKTLVNKKIMAIIIAESETLGDLPTLLQKYVGTIEAPICVFVNKSNNAKAFRALKVDLKVNFVLEQPVEDREVAALLRKLSQLEEEKAKDDTSDLPPELIEKYDSTVYEKLENIDEQIKAIEKSYGSKAELITLRNTVHKIAGSAGAYGYGIAGQMCRAQELFLADIYTPDTLTLTQKEIDEPNVKFFRELRLAFQHISLRENVATQPKAASSNVREAPKPTVLMPVFLAVVTTDLSLVRLFQKIAMQRQLSIEVISDPQNFLEKWTQSDTHPNAIIVEEYFQFTSYTGVELISKLQQKWEGRGVSYGLLTQTDELDKRMHWLELGIDIILKKPLTQENIASIFDKISSRRSPKKIKALIVDDDPDVGNLEVKALEQIGMEVVLLEDETRMIRTLEEHDPDLLILDINLPRYNGRELLQTLRSDIRFRNLIIVVVTAIVDDAFDKWAYAANCDEIIHKPIDIPLVQARVSNLVQRHGSLKSKARLDPTTGLYPRDYFYAKMNDLLARSLGVEASFTMIKIDLWENLTTLLDPLELKDLLIQIAELVKSQFAKCSLVGYLDDGSFGFVYLNMLGGELEFLINAFNEGIRKKVLIQGRENVKVATSAATSIFTVGKISVGIVSGETSRNLAKLITQGKSHCAITRMTQQAGDLHDQREIILVDDDTDLCEVISYSFKNHGYATKVFNNGSDAINYFARLENLPLNTLIILDRVLPDRDGLTVLHLIREKFPGKVKAIFLSSLSTEKDVLEGLKMGALDYLTKPFSISVLLQKALLLLSQ